MALKKQIKETKAAEVKATAETKEEVKTAVKAAEDKVSEKVEEVIETAKKEAQPKEVKATVEKKAQEVKKAAGEVKKTVEETAEKAAKEVKKTAEKVTKEVKKAAPKTTAKKSAAKKEIKTEVVLQYGEKEVNTKDMIASVKKDWTKQKHKISEIKSIELYVKPEDYAVYYVINGEHTGKVWL